MMTFPKKKEHTFLDGALQEQEQELIGQMQHLAWINNSKEKKFALDSITLSFLLMEC